MTPFATATSSLPDEEGTTSSNREKENMPSNINIPKPDQNDDHDGEQDPEDNETEKQEEEGKTQMNNNSNTNQQEKKKKKKSVSFSPNGLCRRSLHIKNYTKSERKRCWYTSKEMKLNKAEIQRTVEKLETNQPIDEITLSRRGVEQYTSTQWKLRTVRRKYAQRVVFKKQMDIFVEATNGGNYEEEYTYNDDDAMKIALVYHQAVRESIASSYMRGVSMRSEELGDEKIYKIHDWSTSDGDSEDYYYDNDDDEEKEPNKNHHEPTSNNKIDNNNATVVLNMNTMQTTLQKEGRIQMRRNSIINSAA